MPGKVAGSLTKKDYPTYGGMGGRGAPKLKGDGKGDLLARVKVNVPKKVSKAEREALENLRKVSRENPREGMVA